MSDQTSHCKRPGKLELTLLAMIVLAGAGLRLANSSHIAIEHFDEGVYASNIWFDAEQGFQYPNRHLYAPPLLPWFAEWAIIFFGPAGLGPHLVSLAAGIATVPLVWWCGRRWFGAEAGIAAAVLAAMNDFHVLYSRVVLTDVLLAWLLLLAVALFWEAFRRDHLGWTWAAGAATGLAWCVKYNGWLPLAIAASGGAAWLLVRRASLREAGRFYFKWLIAAAVALLVWSPVLWELQDHAGGYTAVAENHAKYFVGWSGWLSGIDRHLAIQLQLGGWLTWLSLPMAVCAAMAFGLAAPLEKTSEKSALSRSERHLAAWLLAAWFFGLLAATPLYTPYPRLLAPWLVCCWLVFGAGLQWMVQRFVYTKNLDTSKKIVRLLGAAAMVGLLSLGLFLIGGKRGAAWQDRSGLKKAAAAVIGDVGDSNAVFLVYGEPAVFYHLRAKGAIAFPVADLDFAGLSAAPASKPIFLVAGPHAQQTPRFVEALARSKDRLILVAEHTYRPSDMLLLNRSHPRDLDDSPSEQIRLYRLK